MKGCSKMTNKELQNAYETIMLLYMRKKITAKERDARVVALRPSVPHLSFEQRDAIAIRALRNVAKIMDEVYFSVPNGGGKLQ